MKKFHLIIGCRLVDVADTMAVINPATGESICHCPQADREQLEQAVKAAQGAFPSWAARHITERRTALIRIADAIEARIDELSRLLTMEQGKLLAKAIEELGGSIFIMCALANLNIDDKTVYDEGF